MSYTIQAVTNAGRTAVQTALDQGLALTFSAIKTGNGTYIADEDVSGLTALKSLKNTYPIGSKESDENGITIGAVFFNYDGESIIVAESYNINEVGLFVTVDGTEYLYAVAAVIGDTGQEMPGYDGSNLTQIVQSWYVPLTNEIEVNVDYSDAFALARDLADESESRASADFNSMYDLYNKSTTIETVDNNEVITEVDTTNNVTTVTTIVQTSDTVKTITAVVTPDSGIYEWTKTTTITTTQSGKTITQSVVRSLKGGS